MKTALSGKLLCLLAIAGWCACSNDGVFYLSQGEIFHTTYHIKYRHHTPLSTEIETRLQAFDASLNPFNRQSIISKINRNEPVAVDTFFVAVFNKARDVARQTQGYFDITCAPLINLWGFGFQPSATAPDHAMIDSIRQFAGYRHVWLNGRQIVKDDPRITLNCSAIAKGYSCDVVASLFDSLQIDSYLIEIGGEIRAKGKNPNGVCWKIEIPQPIDDTTGFISSRQEVLEICNKSIATSGNYRNFYLKDGKKYAHTINPLTGYPAESDLLSASVIASDCMTADAYATAFMTMGIEKSCRLAEQLRRSGHEQLDYYFVYSDADGRFRVKTSLRLDTGHRRE
jgi:thiamine biosynthesis lipoprotein